MRDDNDLKLNHRHHREKSVGDSGGGSLQKKNPIILDSDVHKIIEYVKAVISLSHEEKKKLERKVI